MGCDLAYSTKLCDTFPTMDPSRLKIQILHWNQPAACIRTVGCFISEVPSSSISVVDNASSPENLATLRNSLPEGVTLTVLPKNLGWGGGHNVGLKNWLENDVSDYCALSAHDALTSANCFTKLVEALDSQPELGMICPQYETNKFGVFSPIRGPRDVYGEPGTLGTTRYVDIVHGTLMVIRRDCLKQIGLFDERYFAYGDEFDLALRARQSGWKIGMLWGAVAVNPGTAVPRPIVTYLVTRSALLLARVHGGWIAGFVRAALVVLNSFLLLVKSGFSREVTVQVKARIAAVRDFVLHRFGAPPKMG